MKLAFLHLLAFFSLMWFFWGKAEDVSRVWVLGFLYFVWMPFAVLTAVPTWIDVARDGIAWRWLFVRRFIPFSQVVSVTGLPKGSGEATAHRMRILTRDGRKYEVLLGPRARGVLTEVRLALAAPANAAPIEGWLARGRDETARAWIRRLRESAGGAGDRVYRGVAHERLWEPAENAASGAALRCGALLVLCSDEAVRPRARALASTTADPSLVTAIEALANGAPDDEVAPLVERVSK